MVEKTGQNSVHDVELWMQADADYRMGYQIAGGGLVTASTQANSPTNGNVSLNRGVATKIWDFGATLNPPGKVDMIAEVHAATKSIFDPPGKLLTSFIFRRNVPAGEKKSPPVLAVHQCQVVKP